MSAACGPTGVHAGPRPTWWWAVVAEDLSGVGSQMPEKLHKMKWPEPYGLQLNGTHRAQVFGSLPTRSLIKMKVGPSLSSKTGSQPPE